MIDKLPCRSIRPTWVNPASNMTIRYLSHPTLRLAFIQVVNEPTMVYVVSDEPLPGSFVEAEAVVEQWRVDNG
jgi:hypothetical protein